MNSKLLLLTILSLLLNYPGSPQNLRTKIGQMVWTGFTGTRLHDTIKADLRNLNLGGVILFAGNISNPSQVKLLNDTIKMFAATPPFIAVDQEGGRVARLNRNNGFDTSYTAYKLGTVFNREDSTRKMAEKMAGWLHQSGFNVDLAPVADVNVNPLSPAIGKLERSYSAVPESVYCHTKWFSDEFHKKNIAVSLKHFPGHGSAMQDSHLGFTDITNTWTRSELVPYEMLFASGYNDFVMTAHIFNANLDPVYPASLSHKIASGLLRDTLGFTGVTITDAMGMSAITLNYTFEDAAEFAVNAGNDILLYTATTRNGISLTRNLIDIIAQRVEQGIIPLARIDSAYNRIMRMKMRYGLITSAEEFAGNVLHENRLFQNYPNPFTEKTQMRFYVEDDSEVKIEVYNTLGERVAIVADGRFSKGVHEISLSAGHLPPGVYLCRMASGKASVVNKMLILR